MTAVDTFAHSAVEFCTWVASTPADETAEATRATRLLALLYARALDLPNEPLGEIEAEQPSEEEWYRVFQRGRALPFGYYSHANPLEVPTDVVTLGDLADDVADIWADLKAGLWFYQAGRKEDAAAEWKERFDSHWGRHAADALAALHAWHAAHRL